MCNKESDRYAKLEWDRVGLLLCSHRSFHDDGMGDTSGFSVFILRFSVVYKLKVFGWSRLFFLLYLFFTFSPTPNFIPSSYPSFLPFFCLIELHVAWS